MERLSHGRVQETARLRTPIVLLLWSGASIPVLVSTSDVMFAQTWNLGVFIGTPLCT